MVDGVYWVELGGLDVGDFFEVVGEDWDEWGYEGLCEGVFVFFCVGVGV